MYFVVYGAGADLLSEAEKGAESRCAKYDIIQHFAYAKDDIYGIFEAIQGMNAKSL